MVKNATTLIPIPLQFSERLYADLLRYMSNHLKGVNEELESCVSIVWINPYLHSLSSQMSVCLYHMVKKCNNFGLTLSVQLGPSYMGKKSIS